MKLPLAFTISVGLLVPGITHAGSAMWSGGNAGKWGDVAEWGGVTFPNGIGETASFNNSSFFGGGGNITLANSSGADISITIETWSKASSSDGRSVVLNNTAGGTGFLIFDAAGSEAAYTSTSSHANVTDTINVRIQLNNSIHVSGTTRFIRFRNTISESGGSYALRKSGASALELEGSTANTFTGGVTITNGTISAEKNGALGSGDVSVTETSGTTTSTLSITTGVTDAIANDASLFMVSSGVNFSTLALAAGVNETIGALYFDGVQQAAGTWGAAGSGADFTNDNWFSGTGIVTVIPEPSATLCFVLGLAGLLFQRRNQN